MSSLDNEPPSPTPFSTRYKDLLVSQKYTDCTFVINQSTIKCHKLMLSAASSVFEAMFYGPMREEKTIEIVDISPDMFYKMLEYIYTNEISFQNESLENCIEMYYSAEKYLLADLTEICLKEIKTKLSFENILPALDLSVYMNLKGLLRICCNFFTEFCLNNYQFMAFVKTHYYHISKECMKTVITATNRNYKVLLWFVLEWCQNECDNLGLAKEELKKIIQKELDIDMPIVTDNIHLQTQSQRISKSASAICSSTVERTYYKACRPLTITGEHDSAYVLVKPNRFIAIFGVIINSRLMPSLPMERYVRCREFLSSDYKESLTLEIFDECQEKIIFHKDIENICTRYNCDMIINWDEMVTFEPRQSYRIKLMWKPNAYGAEYPASLQSNEVDGIHFEDMREHFGGIIKGLKVLNL